MTRTQGRPAYFAAAILGPLTALTFLILAVSARGPNDGLASALVILTPIAAGVTAGWVAVRRSPTLLPSPATEGLLAGGIATGLAAVVVMAIVAFRPAFDPSGFLGGGGPLLLLMAIPGGVAGMVACDRFALRRWPELREIRKAQSAAQAESMRALASAPDYGKFAYSPASVSGGSVNLRCPDCGSQWSLGADVGSIESERVIRSTQKVSGLPMAPALRWTLAAVAVALLGLGAWPLSLVLGALVLPISPLAPLGDYMLGRKLPVFLVGCASCGKHLALLAGDGALLVSQTTVPPPPPVAES